ncbi:MAG: YqjK family protein [Fluviibacter sp.]|jgi:hypothetical protein
MSAIKARAIQRGRLLERITQQRLALSVSNAPLCDALNTVDQVIEGAERTRRWVTENPLTVGVGLLALVIWRPKGALKLAKNGVLGWRAWRLARQQLRAFLA